MSTYVVFEHPNLGHRIETIGSAPVALLFAPHWLLIKGLYLPAMLSFGALLAIFTVHAGINRSADTTMASVFETPQAVLNEDERYNEIYWYDVEPASAGLSRQEMRKGVAVAHGLWSRVSVMMSST